MEKSLSNSSHQIEGFIQQILNHNSQNVPQGRMKHQQGKSAWHQVTRYRGSTKFGRKPICLYATIRS